MVPGVLTYQNTHKMIHKILMCIENQELSEQARMAASEYLDNSQKIRSLEKRQTELLHIVKASFDKQYSNNSSTYKLISAPGQ